MSDTELLNLLESGMVFFRDIVRRQDGTWVWFDGRLPNGNRWVAAETFRECVEGLAECAKQKEGAM